MVCLVSSRPGSALDIGGLLSGAGQSWATYPTPSQVGSNPVIDLEVGCRHLEDVVSIARLVVVASLITAVTSACTMIAQAPSSQLQGTTPTDAQRRECERNGGYWATAAGFCRVGA
jgi:hypothetical protein